MGASTPTRTERTIFLGATALIALHVLADNFLQPESGTSAGDHFLSGLVPLALLGLAALAYAGRRPGARAAIALLVGLFGIAAGLEGWHYTLTASPSGDDFTSLLAMPAGVALLGLAAVTLWASRRTDDSLVRRYGRRALIGLGALVAGLMVVYPLLAAYGYTHLSRGFVPDPELGAEFEDATFETADGLGLEGWYIPSENGAAVIAFPGRKGTQDPARLLAEHGYGVLLFDRRGEGESDGEPNSLGWGGYRDVDAAVDFLVEHGVDPERIGGLGQSVGGEMMIEAAARSGELGALVSEGAGVRSSREAADLPDQSFLGRLNIAMLTAGVALFSNQGPPPDLEELVADVAPTPILLIYSADGQGGEELNRQYFEAAGEPKELWEADGGHVGSQDADPEEYERRVVGFFDEALLGDRG
jgi:dienelactone hydrolase